MNISVVIPVGGNYKDRLYAYRESVNSLKHQTFKDFEIVVIEQLLDVSNRVPLYNTDGVRHFTLTSPHNEGVYNISWGINFGIRLSKGELVVATDGDFLYPSDWLEKVWSYYKETGKNFFVPWTKLNKLSLRGKANWDLNHNLAEINDPKYHHKLPDGYNKGYMDPRPNGAAGLHAYKRDWFLNTVGGYNESFFGWGCADNELAMRIQDICGEYPTMEAELYHIPHGKITKYAHNNFEKYKKFFYQKEHVTNYLIGKTGHHSAPINVPFEGKPLVYLYNFNVGSGIQRIGDNTYDCIKDDYTPVNYYAQNPPSILFRDIIRQKPDVVIMNEFYPRICKAVYFYKLTNPNTKIILLNHCYDLLTLLPFKKDYERTDTDGTVLLNDLFFNEIDHFINLNYHPPNERYHRKVAPKVIDAIHPIEDKFKYETPWIERPKNFMYFGNLHHIKFNPEFIDAIEKTQMKIDVYGKIDTAPEDIQKRLKSSPNIKFGGFIPEEKLVETINSYKFMVVPHNGYEPFNLAIAEAIRCGTIPIVTNPEGSDGRGDWLGWANDFYIRCTDIEHMIQTMNNAATMNLQEEAESASEEMIEKTSLKLFRERLISLIEPNINDE